MEDHAWLLGLVLGALALTQLASIARSLASIGADLEGLAAMKKRLLSHQGVYLAVDMKPSERVRQLAFDPKTYVEAIRAYREQTGLGLREAKAVVDQLSRSPQRTA